MNQYEYQVVLHNGGMSVAEAVDRIKHHHAVAGDDTKYWYEYACGKMKEVGMLDVNSSNPPEKIIVHLATLALITEEFQTILLDEESMFEYEYEAYFPGVSLNMLENVYRGYFKQIDSCEEDDMSECEGDSDEERIAVLCECLIELDREAVAEVFGFGSSEYEESFIALALSAKFPTAQFEEFADMIEREYPVDVDDLRDRDGFASFNEYKRYLMSDDAADFVLGNLDGMDNPCLEKALHWVVSACPKVL